MGHFVVTRPTRDHPGTGETNKTPNEVLSRGAIPVPGPSTLAKLQFELTPSKTGLRHSTSLGRLGGVVCKRYDEKPHERHS